MASLALFWSLAAFIQSLFSSCNVAQVKTNLFVQGLALTTQCCLFVPFYVTLTFGSGLFRESQTKQLFSALSPLWQTLRIYLLLIWEEVKNSSHGLVCAKKEDCNKIIYYYTGLFFTEKCPRVPVRHSWLDLESDVASAAFKKKIPHRNVKVQHLFLITSGVTDVSFFSFHSFFF